jgi:hypothetical protein
MNRYDTLFAWFDPQVGLQQPGVSALHKLEGFAVKSGIQVVMMSSLLLQIGFEEVRYGGIGKSNSRPVGWLSPKGQLMRTTEPGRHGIGRPGRGDRGVR